MISETINLHVSEEEGLDTRDVLNEVLKIMDEKGYHSKEQVVGYLITGDPSYIPRVGAIRNVIRQIPRERILRDLLDYYIDENN